MDARLGRAGRRRENFLAAILQLTANQGPDVHGDLYRAAILRRRAPLLELPCWMSIANCS